MSRIEQVKSLFYEALNLPGGTDLGGWLEDRCCGDKALVGEIQSLLDAHTEMGRGTAGLWVPAPPDVPTARFGAYRAVELVGKGGMSTVYRARREDGAFEQTVAVKIMAGHLGGGDFLRRFETEQQLLASLSHPNITRLLDGGVSSAGDPFLVMEFVEGQTIDRYCDERKLPVAARLRIFLQVCAAVGYAHHHLIVHRDLKPGNILVSGDGVVKLLDFGTASLLEDLGDATVTRLPMFTARYASPEQLRGERAGVASDVFSLGVVFYELLTGAWPFGSHSSVLSDLSRAMADTPAAALVTSITEDAAERRSIPRQQLRSLLKGDLSAIALKALENEPARRYESVGQFALDVEAYLGGRPVRARPQTVAYRARKFVRRHRIGVAGAAIFTSGLITATGVAIHQAQVAREAAARAERVSAFAKNTFLSASSGVVSPNRGQSHAIQFTDVLDNAAERAGKELGTDPLAEAEMRSTIGMTYSVLGDPAKGEAQLRQALELLRKAGHQDSRVQYYALACLCDTLSYEGRYVEALEQCRASLALARSQGWKETIGATLHDTAFMLGKSGGRLEDVEKLFREALEYLPADPLLARMYPALMNTRIASIRIRLGDLVEGENLARAAESELRAEPGPPIEMIPTLAARGFGARVRGDYGEAIRLLREAVDMLTARPTPYMGQEDIEVELAADEALAGDKASLGRLQRVEQAARAGDLAAVERIRHDLLAGTVEARYGSKSRAEQLLRAALATAQKETPQQPGNCIEIGLRLAELLSSEGKSPEAAQVAGEALRKAQAAYGHYFAKHPFATELERLTKPAR